MKTDLTKAMEYITLGEESQVERKLLEANRDRFRTQWEINKEIAESVTPAPKPSHEPFRWNEEFYKRVVNPYLLKVANAQDKKGYREWIKFRKNVTRLGKDRAEEI